MATVLLESFSGVSQGDMSTATMRQEAVQKLNGKWTVVSTLSTAHELVETDTVCFGYACTTGNGQSLPNRHMYYDFTTLEQDDFAVFGCRAMIDDLSGGQVLALLGERKAGGTRWEYDIQLFVSSGGSLQVRRENSSDLTVLCESGAGTVTASQAFFAGVEFKKHATAGTIKLFLGGVVVATFTGNTHGSSTPAGTLVKGVFLPAVKAGSWLTSAFVFNSLGTRNRLYPGARHVGVKHPYADGDNEEWDPGAGAGGNWGVVDEKDVDDAVDYIVAESANLQDLYAFPPAEGTGDVDSVQITTRHSKSAAVTAEYVIQAKLGSTASSPTITTVGTAWGNGRDPFDSTPSGGSWSVGDLDAAMFGVNSGTIASGELRIEQLYLEYLIENYEPTNCGGAGTPGETPEFEGDQLPVPSLPGTPEVPSRAIDDMTWAHEDPGGFADGSFSIPHHIQTQPDVAHFEDLIVVDPVDGEVLYQGRVEPIDRVSTREGMRIRYGTFGWQRNAIDDYLYSGRLQDLRLDAWAGYAGVGPGDYVDQFSTSAVLGFSDGEPYITVNLPAGTGLNQPSGGVVQYDWRTNHQSPNPEIQRCRITWSVNKVTPGALFEIIAYAPIGDYSSPVTIYSKPHVAGTQTINLFRDDTGFAVDESVIPEGTWRLLIRPYAFSFAVGTVPEPGLIMHLWDFCVGQMPTALPMSPSTVVDRVVTDSCPALDTGDIDFSAPATVHHVVYEQPTRQADIFKEMLLFAPDDWTWWVREKLENGKYHFFWGPRSQEVEYVTTGVEIQPLGADVQDLCNRIEVSFTDFLGRPQTVVVEQTIEALDEVGIIRTKYRDVGKLRGLNYKTNLANATQIANALAYDCSRPARAGQLRIIGKKVRDASTLAPIPFYKLKPGKLIRIGDTSTEEPTANPLDDPAVWRIRRIDFALGMRMEAILTVGQGSSNVDAIIARLQASTSAPDL